MTQDSVYTQAKTARRPKWHEQRVRSDLRRQGHALPVIESTDTVARGKASGDVEKAHAETKKRNWNDTGWLASLERPVIFSTVQLLITLLQ